MEPMEPKHRLSLFLFAMLFAMVLGFDCNSATVRAQQEKTKQLQIMQAMQLYQAEQDADPRPYRPRYF